MSTFLFAAAVLSLWTLIIVLVILSYARQGIPLAQLLWQRRRGWEGLLARYRVKGQPRLRQRFVQQSLQVGETLYPLSNLVGISDAGLYLHNHRLGVAVRIPWRDLTAAAPATLVTLPAIQLTLGDPPAETLTISMEIFNALQPYLRETRLLPQQLYPNQAP